MKLLSLFLIILSLTFLFGCAQKTEQKQDVQSPAGQTTPVPDDMTLVDNSTSEDSTAAVDTAADNLSQDLDSW